MFVTNIKIAFLEDILEDIGLSYNTENTRMSTIISLANKKNRSEAKFLTMIPITFRVKGTLAWFTEFDTAKIGVRRWSNSVMHSVLKDGITMENFEITCKTDEITALCSIQNVNEIKDLFANRVIDKREAKKRIKKAIGSNFYYTSRITMSYENLRAMYHDRINHELDWWQVFLKGFEHIPYFDEFITGETK